MSIEYKFNINQLDCYPDVDGEVDVVFTVHYTYEGEQFIGGEPLTGSVYGTVGVTLDAESPFTPYADLTKEQVVGWVTDALGADWIKSAQENIAGQIDNQANPKVISPALPWAAPVEVVPSE